jgi:uncharacterized protein
VSHAYGDIAFTPAVKAAQERDGSRAGYARNFERDSAIQNSRLSQKETEFISAQRSFYMATVSETGWPYVQHRGGPPGFLKVLNDQTLAFADYAGNRQMISVGNLTLNDRIALILVDYQRGTRLKILGHVHVHEFVASDKLDAHLLAPGYRARPQRVMKIAVAAFDWNCPQHIPVRYEAEEVERSIAERDLRIAELERRLGQSS